MEILTIFAGVFPTFFSDALKMFNAGQAPVLGFMKKTSGCQLTDVIVTHARSLLIIAWALVLAALACTPAIHARISVIKAIPIVAIMYAKSHLSLTGLTTGKALTIAGLSLSPVGSCVFRFALLAVGSLAGGACSMPAPFGDALLGLSRWPLSLDTSIACRGTGGAACKSKKESAIKHGFMAQ
jgi:hypothetical protein